jgi:TM2 domain-containing membrane protein YozV
MKPPKNPATAQLLSCFIPGLGQLYNGQLGKALFFFLTWVLVLLWPVAIIDAFESATKINNEAYAAEMSKARGQRKTA